jgi:hypothetical protein
MLFKVIDPNFVLSDTYRDWPIETKVTYTVICALANYKTGEFYHSTQIIAYHANLCRRAVQRSLKRMVGADIITLVEKRHGKSSRYRYNFPVMIHKKDRGDPGVMGGVTHQSPQGRLPSRQPKPKDDPQTIVESAFTDVGSPSNNMDLNKWYLTTTTYILKLISKIIGERNIKKVIRNVVVVLKNIVKNLIFDPG